VGWTRFVESPACGEHAVHVYTDAEDLTDSVGSFLHAGLAAGSPAIAIVTEEHWVDLTTRLESLGWDIAQLLAERRLVHADAAEMLEALLEDGRPSPVLFQEIVGGLVTELEHASPGRTIRAFGEMVDLLWQREDESAAVELEELWNELAETHDFALLCAYRLDVFDLDVQRRALPAVLRTHSHARTVADPPGLSAALDQALFDAVGPTETARIYLDAAEDVRHAHVPHAQELLGWLAATDAPLADRILRQLRPATSTGETDRDRARCFLRAVS
jgi:hypothetical protein